MDKPKGCTDECTYGNRVPSCTATYEERMNYCGQQTREERRKEEASLWVKEHLVR